MARYTITLNVKDNPKPFVGFDDLDSSVVEATYQKSLGVYASRWQIAILSDLEPGESKNDGVMTYFREW